MATIKQVVTAIKEKYPIAHDSFTTQQSLPFVCWTDQGSEDFYADDLNYLHKSRYNIELYTKYKSKADEKILQDILIGLKISYSRIATVKVPDENSFMTVFIFELTD